jgi:hypothetical protein
LPKIIEYGQLCVGTIIAAFILGGNFYLAILDREGDCALYSGGRTDIRPLEPKTILSRVEM